MKLDRLELSELSQIKVDIFAGHSSIRTYSKIMVIKYSGKYGLGSSGDSDARYMYAMGKAALSAWRPSGVILDWIDLEYEWGDMLDLVLDIGADQYINAKFPMAIIVGPKCKEAFRTLVLGLDSKEPIESIDWVFKDLDSAWSYIDSLLSK